MKLRQFSRVAQQTTYKGGGEVKIVKYIMFGVELYAVEDSNGFILKYCSTKELAKEALKEV